MKKRIEGKILAMLAARRWQKLARSVAVWHAMKQGAFDMLGAEAAGDAAERLQILGLDY